MNDTTWTSTCSPDVARASMEFLGDVCEEFDMLHEPIIVSPYIHGMGIGQRDNVRRARIATANMLVKRGVLKSAEYFDERRPYADPRAEGIRIVADEVTVRETHHLLRDRVFGPRPSAVPKPAPAMPKVDLPAPVMPTVNVNPTINVSPSMTMAPPTPPASASPPPPDPIAEEIRRTHRVERTKMPYVIAAGVITALIVAALSGGLKFVSEKWRDANAEPKNPTAAESTAVPAKSPKNPAAAESTATGVGDDAWRGAG